MGILQIIIFGLMGLCIMVLLYFFIRHGLEKQSRDNLRDAWAWVRTAGIGLLVIIIFWVVFYIGTAWVLEKAIVAVEVERMAKHGTPCRSAEAVKWGAWILAVPYSLFFYVVIRVVMDFLNKPDGERSRGPWA